VRIGADQVRDSFGQGRGIVVGVLGCGIDGHAACFRPGQVSGRDFTEDMNRDVGHESCVAAIIAGSVPGGTGLAPATRLVDARNTATNFPNIPWPKQHAVFKKALAYCADRGCQAANMSLGWGSDEIPRDGNESPAIACDEIVDRTGMVLVGCTGNADNVLSPGDAYNVITVGPSQGPQYVRSMSPTGKLVGGRCKPDLVAPGSHVGTPYMPGMLFGGSSAAAPVVTGVVALEIGYGLAHGLSTDARLIKATLLNSAEKIANSEGRAWQPALARSIEGIFRIERPLDYSLGAGQVHAGRLYRQYTGGKAAGASINAIGWDLQTIDRGREHTFYFKEPVRGGARITMTLVWNRHLMAQSSAARRSSASLAHLDLALLLENLPLAISASSVDNVQHICWNVSQPGRYALKVSRAHDERPAQEKYALAWCID
jgi:serine protease AprX